jgi:ribosomal protein S18 acetylase RimI-like enzyme
MISASRPYSGAADLQSMIDLLVAVRPADRITDYPSIVDLREALALASVQISTRLWYDADGLIGFAFVDPYNGLRFELDWQAADPDLESEMVTWGEQCIRRAMQECGQSPILHASCRNDDTERIALLERYGFLMQETRTLHMVRPLGKPIPTPQVPVGFHLRHVAGEQEVRALVALHRAAFGTERMTVEERLAMMRVPEYDSELDLLVIAPDGRFAAYCMCSISQEENERSGRNEGYTDPIATHPDFQRRGLARALLLTGLSSLKQRGIDTAVLYTSSENVAMQRTAEAVGFCVRSAKLWFAKPVSQDGSAG